MATRRQLSKEFIILGPQLEQKNGVLEAIHALYFLPENYKLVFTGQGPVDEALHKQVATIIERDDLGHRVLFFSDARSAQAVIVRGQEKAPAKNAVQGDSPEALASAILDLARAKA